MKKLILVLAFMLVAGCSTRLPVRTVSIDNRVTIFSENARITANLTEKLSDGKVFNNKKDPNTSTIILANSNNDICFFQLTEKQTNASKRKIFTANDVESVTASMDFLYEIKEGGVHRFNENRCIRIKSSLVKGMLPTLLLARPFTAYSSLIVCLGSDKEVVSLALTGSKECVFDNEDELMEVANSLFFY